MKSTVIVAGLLAAVAAAQPHAHGHGHHHRRQQHGHHDKRGTVVTWVTETVYETVTEIIDDTTTELIMPSTKPASTTSSSSTTLSPSPGVFFQGPETSTVAPTTTHAPAVVVPPPAPVVQSSSSSSSSVAPPPAPAPAAPSSSSVAPAVVPAPSPASSSAAAPPAQANSGSGSGSSSGGKQYSGDLTYFTLGLGSCGFDDTGKDMTENYVAASAALMGSVSNGNPLCGRTVTITANGKTAKATIRDKCPPCTEGSLDASTALFIELFGSTDGGREKITWTLDD